jgi:dihydroorotate dehydrogenase (fumarate)
VIDLTTRYLGLDLCSPLVASAGPLTQELDTLRRLEAAGAAAVVLPSLFEEDIVHAAHSVDRLLSAGTESFPEALTYLPEMADYDTGPRRHIELVEAAAAELGVPVIASVNGTTPGGWVRYAGELARAGADAIELNLYQVVADFDATASDVEAHMAELVAAVRAEIDVPLAVKIGPWLTAPAHTARALVAAGADGLVLFNRFYQPDIDLETLEVRPHLVLSTSVESRLPLHWIAILSGRVDASLAASTGVHTADDVAKLLLVGADVVMSTSALLTHGPEHLRMLEAGLRAWMAEREYESVAQLRGSMSQRNVPDPTAYERANYIQELRSFAGLS